MMIALFAASWRIWWNVRGRPANYLKPHLQVSVLSVFYVFYIGITKNVMRVFDCVSVEELVIDPTNSTREWASVTFDVWVLDTDVGCWEPEHLMLVLVAGIPSLLFVSVGFPVWLLIFLRYMHERSEENVSSQAYKFLYEAYNPRSVYWEAFVMLRKGLLATISVFAVSLGPRVQGILSTGVIFLATLIHAWRKPFDAEKPQLNVMELVSLTSLFLVFFMGSLLNDSDIEDSSEARDVISSLLIIVLASTFVYLSIHLLKEMWKQLHDTSIPEIISNAIPKSATAIGNAFWATVQKLVEFLSRWKVFHNRRELNEL